MYHGGPDTNKWGPKTAAYPGKVLASMPQTNDITLDDLNAIAGNTATPQAQPAAASSAPITLDDLHAMTAEPAPTAAPQATKDQSWSDYLKNQFGLVVGQYKQAG